MKCTRKLWKTSCLSKDNFNDILNFITFASLKIILFSITNLNRVYLWPLYAKRDTPEKICHKFANLKCSGPRVLDDATQVEVLGHSAADTCISVEKVSDITHVTSGSVCRVTRLHNHPSKIQMLQLCEEMTQFIGRTPNLPQNICFTDECIILLNINRTADIGVTQYPEKNNVWVRILRVPMVFSNLPEITWMVSFIMNTRYK